MLLTQLSYENKSIFTRDDVKRIVGNPTVVLNQLVRKKWIMKIRREVYAIVPLNAGPDGSDSYTLVDFVIGSLLTKPYYIGYWSALNYYGFTQQTPSRVYIATTRTKPLRRVINVECKFVTLVPHKMFGIETVILDDHPVRISSPEKTFVDCIDHPEHAGGIDEVAQALYFCSNEINLTTLANLALEMRNTAIIKRLGYLSELFELDEVLQVISKAHISDKYSPLDPFSKRDGKLLRRWMLKINEEIDPERWMWQSCALE